MPEPLDLDAIEARANDATKGPWAIEWDEDDVTDTPFPVSIGPIGYLEHRGEREAADAEFVAAARADVPALVAEVRRLRAVADASEHVHRVLHGLIAAEAVPGVQARSAWDALDTALIAYRSTAKTP